MLEEIYQGKYAWVLTPDAVLEKSIQQIASRFPEQTIVSAERPCLYLAGGEMKIAKSEIIKYRAALMELKDEHIKCSLTKVENRMTFLTWSCDELPKRITDLITSTEVFLQPFVTGLHFKPLSGSIVISRLQKDKQVDTFEQTETFHAEHLQFIELDDNFLKKVTKFQVF